MTDPITIDNISSFFELSKYEYRIFDMSRTVRPIDNETFKKIESQQVLFPTPFQQHAWLGIIFWHPESINEPAIWFLKFPIDELGFLKLEARDRFIQEMLEQVGDKIKKETDNTEENPTHQKDPKETDDPKHESAFAFKPQQDKMAIFNSLATRALGQKPSKFYPHAHNYFKGTPGFDQWSFMGFQGLADIAVNLDSDDNMHHVAGAIPHMPEQPLILFAQLLEHGEPDAALSKALLARISQELDSSSVNITLVASLARGLSNSSFARDCTKLLLTSSANSDIEVLAVIASRLWENLKDKAILKDYLEALALQKQQSFDVILMELLPIPGMRDYLLDGLKNPQRSSALARRIGGFMKRFQAS